MPVFPQNGDCPVHISSAMGRRKLTKILLEANPDLTIRNQQKETPEEIAVRKEHTDSANILRVSEICSMTHLLNLKLL